MVKDCETQIYHVGCVGGVDDSCSLVELHLGLELVVLPLHVHDHRVQEVDLKEEGSSVKIVHSCPALYFGKIKIRKIQSLI